MSVGVQRLREEPDRIRQGAIDKREDPSVVDRAIEVDATRRRLQAESDTLKAERNTASKQVGEAIRGGARPDGPEVAELRAASTRGRRADRGHRRRARGRRGRARGPPAPHPQPRGPRHPGRRRGGERHDPELGRPAANEATDAEGATWARKPHWELGEALDIIDNVRGAKVAGSGFPVYKGAGSRLQRALISWFLDVHTAEHGFTEIWPPVVINATSARGTGQIPDKEDQMYVVTRDDLYLTPTAEVPVTNLHRDEILEATELPIRYAAYSPCFRREAGAAGKDTRGILRVHQFDKVEMVLFEKPDDSPAALEWLTERAEVLLQRLGLPYRVLLMATGRHGLRPAAQVRRRGVGAGRGTLARGELVLQPRGLPGAPHGDPLPADAGREARARPHAERLGARACRGSWRRCSRPTSRPTARSRCPRCSGPTWGWLRLGRPPRPEANFAGGEPVTDQPTPETDAAADDAPEPADQAPTNDALVLTAPPAVAPVAPTQAESSLAVDPKDVARLDSMVDRYLEGVASLDVHGADFAKRVDEIRTMGDKDIRASASRLERLLEKPLGVDDAGRPQRGIERRRSPCSTSATPSRISIRRSRATCWPRRSCWA